MKKKKRLTLLGDILDAHLEFLFLQCRLYLCL